MTKLYTSNFILFFLLHVSFLSAQDIVPSRPEKNVPAIVQAKFNEKFPGNDPVWFSQFQGRYDNRMVYEGRFIFDNRYSSAIYDKGGNMIAFAATVEEKELPAKALQYMKDNFPNFPIADAMLVTRGKDNVKFEIGIFIDGELVVKVFDEDGKFIKSTKG